MFTSTNIKIAAAAKITEATPSDINCIERELLFKNMVPVIDLARNKNLKHLGGSIRSYWKIAIGDDNITLPRKRIHEIFVELRHFLVTSVF